MTITDADAAIDAEIDAIDQLVDKAPAVTSHDEGTIVDAASSPCNAEEARALIRRAITASTDFYDAIDELLTRQGHVALGYDSPRQMLSRELAGMLTNPRTGKPVSDTHLRRMTRVAWLAWSIAQTTDIDMSKLSLTERSVRSISAAAAGVNDVDLIDEIHTRLTEVGAEGPDQVNEIVHDVLANFEEGQATKDREPQKKPAPATPDDDYDDLDDDAGGGPSRAPGAGTGGQPPEQGGRGRPDPTSGNHDEPDDTDLATGPGAEAETPTPPAPPSVTSLFDTAMPAGIEPASDYDVSSVLTHMRSAADVRRAMTEAVRILNLMPEITKIQKSVPHVIDAIDDDDLDAIREELTGTEKSVKWATKTLEVIAAAIEEVDVRIDEAI